MKNRRKNPRIDVRVPASYDCYDDYGELVERNFAIILDVSIGGMLIETDDIVEANYITIIFVNHENRNFSITGSVVHSRKTDDGRVKTGICFHGSKKEGIKVVTNLIRTHYYGGNANHTYEAQIAENKPDSSTTT